MDHLDQVTLNDLKDGLLDPEDEAGARAHLEACATCRREFESLSDLVDGLASIPIEARPSRDLWPQIAWRMEGVRGGGEVEPAVSDSHAPRTRGSSLRKQGRGRFVLVPAWQLVAAGIVLMIASGVSVWAVVSRAPQGAPYLPGPETGAEMAGWEEAYGGYNQAVADLGAILQQGRDVLDPETVRVLEENLRIIDQAILESEEALKEDPASTVLQRFLADIMRKKVDLLRQAAGAVLATT